MTSVQTEVASLARRLSHGLDAEEALAAAVDQLAQQQVLPLTDRSALASSAFESTLGYGVLQPYFDDESIEEVWINRPNELFIARAGVTERIFLALSADEIAALVERMLRHSGRRLDRSSPFVDAALADGSRLHVIIPDIAREHWSVNIRKFPKDIWRLSELVERNVLTLQQARFLAGQMRAGKNILVAGATQAGKTTLLCSLLSETSPAKRLVTVEETFEIRAVNFDWVALQTRQANLRGEVRSLCVVLLKKACECDPSCWSLARFAKPRVSIC